MDCEDRLQLIKWLIDREDRLRGSTSSRGAIVLSANALLFTGITILVKYFLDNRNLSVLIVLLLSAAMLSLMGSAVCALSTSATLWRRSSAIAKVPYENRLLINAHATISFFKQNFSGFDKAWCTVSKKELFSRTLTELWAIQHLYRTRYKMLRWSLRLFILTLALLISLGIISII